MEIIRPAESVNLLPPKNKEIINCDLLLIHCKISEHQHVPVESFTFLGPIFVNW